MTVKLKLMNISPQSDIMKLQLSVSIIAWLICLLMSNKSFVSARIGEKNTKLSTKTEGKNLPHRGLHGDECEDDDEGHTPSIVRALQADYFQIKLYWEEGYFWQEERQERRWCAECEGSCESGNRVLIKTCDDDDKKQRWILKDDKLHPHTAQNLCMHHENKREFILRTCQTDRNRYQKFDYIKQNKGSKFDVYEFHARDSCMTQRHHPKSGERVRLEPCGQARGDDTAMWELGPGAPYNEHA